MSVRGVVVVAHGGRSVGTEPTTAWQPAVLRMIPVALAIRRSLRGQQVSVRRIRFRRRGWNGPAASPVPDLTELLDQIGDQLVGTPVVLVGHSMGGRAVLRAAGHPAVVAAVGLAPWLPDTEPVEQLAGRRVLLVHGTADRITSPAQTWAYAERARGVTQVATIEIRNGKHAMLSRPWLWHALAAEYSRLSLGLSDDGRGPDGPADSIRQATTASQRRIVL